MVNLDVESDEDINFEGSETEIKIQQILHDCVSMVEQDGGAIGSTGMKDCYG